MNFMRNEFVLLLCIFVCLLAVVLQTKNFLRIVKRMRWLFISIFIIYAYDTPGEYIHQFSTSFAPTIEGCILGTLQIAKLMIALATLGILFISSSKTQLMAGLYMLLSPLNFFGFNVKRFTARLLLTLEYVEEFAIKENFNIRFDQLANIHLATDDLREDKVIIVEVLPFTILDKALIALFFISAVVLIYFKGIS
jgi:energy-coupling factor transport system permease protein